VLSFPLSCKNKNYVSKVHTTQTTVMAYRRDALLGLLPGMAGT